MVCVSTSFLLVVFIIAALRKKVNRSEISFTICLQNSQIYKNSFTIRSKSCRYFRVDSGLPLCYYFAC